MAVIIGIETLSFIGNGKYSTNIAIAAPTTAIQGVTNSVAAKKAAVKPESEPSKVFPLFNGNFMPSEPPKIEATLSPKVNMAIAAALIGKGKTSSVNRIPKA